MKSYSSCWLEALKAKYKDPKGTKILFTTRLKPFHFFYVKGNDVFSFEDPRDKKSIWDFKLLYTNGVTYRYNLASILNLLIRDSKPGNKKKLFNKFKKKFGFSEDLLVFSLEG